MIHPAGRDGGAEHGEQFAAGFVLCDGQPPRVLDGPEAGRTVAVAAGQDDRDGTRAEARRHRLEQHIPRRADRMHLFRQRERERLLPR